MAICDRRTVKRDDLVAVDKVHEKIWEEGLYLKYRNSWFWKSRQTRDEVLMFVSWASTEAHEDMESLVGNALLFSFWINFPPNFRHG